MVATHARREWLMGMSKTLLLEQQEQEATMAALQEAMGCIEPGSANAQVLERLMVQAEVKLADILAQQQQWNASLAALGGKA